MKTRVLVDVGNSRVKWALAEGGRLLPGDGRAHGGDPAGALADAALPPVDEVWVADVVRGARREAVARVLQQRCSAVPRFATVRAQHAGLTCAYADPSRLGVDRWLMLLAAWSHGERGACVAGAGTALTFDAVDGVGRHRGGCIAPGIGVMQRAVLDATTFTLLDSGTVDSDSLGVDTETCVRQGALNAAAGMLDRLAARYGAEVDCLLAGGDAERLLPLLHTRWQHRPALVLEGLLAFALTETAD
ncbi:MAG TPA: type III pantothenate kinase [Nevskiaceae bacterium]|nr:type III pantothenate kinase [Nevskiaceae bacterium]